MTQPGRRVVGAEAHPAHKKRWPGPIDIMNKTCSLSSVRLGLSRPDLTFFGTYCPSCPFILIITPMGVVTAARAYGRECTLAFLDRSENERVQSKRATGIQYGIDLTRKDWRRCVRLLLGIRLPICRYTHQIGNLFLSNPARILYASFVSCEELRYKRMVIMLRELELRLYPRQYLELLNE